MSYASPRDQAWPWGHPRSAERRLRAARRRWCSWPEPSCVACGRTGAVGGHTWGARSSSGPWQGSQLVSTKPLGEVPHPHDDVQRYAPGRPAGHAREWSGGRALGRLVLAGVPLLPHQADGGGREGTAGMEKTARPAFPQALGEDVLEEPAEHLHDVEGGGAEAGTAHFAVGEGARAVRKRDDTLGGDGDLADRRGEGGAGGVAVVMRLPGNVPGAKPALGIAMLSEPGLAHLFFAERTGEGRECLDRDKDVGTGGAPGRAVPGEAAAGHHVMEVRVVLEWPPPGG